MQPPVGGESSGGGAAGANQPMQVMLDHQWCDRWNLDHLVTQRLKVISL
jgi:hypothetical protein